MNWLVDNWSLIIVIVIVLIYFFLNGKKSVMEWLLYAVTMSERDFSDSGMGWIKLKNVYDSFVSVYPIFSKILPYSLFCKWVDIALDEMRKVLKENKNIKKYVDEFKEGEQT